MSWACRQDVSNVPLSCHSHDQAELLRLYLLSNSTIEAVAMAPKWATRQGWIYTLRKQCNHHTQRHRVIRCRVFSSLESCYCRLRYHHVTQSCSHNPTPIQSHRSTGARSRCANTLKHHSVRSVDHIIPVISFMWSTFWIPVDLYSVMVAGGGKKGY